MAFLLNLCFTLSTLKHTCQQNNTEMFNFYLIENIFRLHYRSVTFREVLVSHCEQYTKRQKFTPTSVDKQTLKCMSNNPGDSCCSALPLDATSLQDGYPTTKELVCSAVSKERASNYFAKCISQTILSETKWARHSCGGLVRRPCLWQLWTAFALACTAAHTDQRAAHVVICTYEQ